MSLSVDTLKARTAGAAVTTTEGLNVGGACTATSFVGDGTNLTNVGVDTATVNTDQLNVIGVATASSFVGNVTGTATGLSGTPDITVRNVTGVAATFTGVLTYEDVTNVDSVGIVTARGGLEVGAAGVGGTITAVGNAILSGITTVAGGTFYVKGGEGSAGQVHIYSDEGDDNADKWRLLKAGGDNQLKIQNYQSGSWENGIILHGEGAFEAYHDNSKKLETLTTGVQVTGVTSTTSLSVGPGVVQEKLYTVASALTGTVNFDVVDNGLVQYYTTNSSGTFVVNLRGDGSTTFNSLMDIGKTSVFTLYSAQNNTSYYMTDFQIDGSSITEKWNGGSAPSAGTGSGVDVYTFNIMKTGDATFTVFATFSNFA